MDSQVSLEQLVSQVLEVLLDPEVSLVLPASEVIPDLKDKLDNLERRDHRDHQDSGVLQVQMDSEDLLDRREPLELLDGLEVTDSQVTNCFDVL